MNFIAHRGLYNEKIGENTITAFDNAFNNAFIGVELDVRKTKDGKIVVIHDAFISRVSNGIGLVKSLTYDELLNYNFGRQKIERIPLLSEVINRYHGKLFVIELKENINLDELNLNDNNTYYISSFHYDFIKNIPKSSKYKRGVINYLFNTNIDIRNIDFIMLLDDLVTNEVYDFYSSRGIEVIIYGIGRTINSKIREEIRAQIKYIT